MASLPCWIRKDGGRLLVDESKADIVRRIFEWATNGCGCKQIVTKLNEQQIPSITVGTRKNCRAWNPTFVQKIITGRAVLGSDFYPPIIDAETYEAAQAALKSRTRHKGNQGKNVPNLFTGLLFDARTKEPMRRTGGKNGDYLTSPTSPFGWRYEHFEAGFLERCFQEQVLDRRLLKSRIGQIVESIWLLIEEYHPKMIRPPKERRWNRLPFASIKQPVFRISTVQVRWTEVKTETFVLWRRGTKWGHAEYSNGPQIDLRHWHGRPLYGSYDECPSLVSVRHLYQPVRSSRQRSRRAWDEKHGVPKFD